MVKNFEQNDGMAVIPEIVCQAIPEPDVAEKLRAAGATARGENAGVEIVIPLALAKDAKSLPGRDM